MGIFGGYTVAPIAVIDTKEGLIAFDTGDAKHDGEILLEAIRTVSKKPIKAIIYGHSHTVHGAGVFAECNKDVIVIGKPGLNEKVAESAAASGILAYYPEVGPYLLDRAVIQFNGYLPKEGPDGGRIHSHEANKDSPFSSDARTRHLVSAVPEKKTKYFGHYFAWSDVPG